MRPNARLVAAAVTALTVVGCAGGTSGPTAVAVSPSPSSAAVVASPSTGPSLPPRTPSPSATATMRPTPAPTPTPDVGAGASGSPSDPVLYLGDDGLGIGIPGGWTRSGEVEH